jgi:hypothetical protein
MEQLLPPMSAHILNEYLMYFGISIVFKQQGYKKRYNFNTVLINKMIAESSQLVPTNCLELLFYANATGYKSQLHIFIHIFHTKFSVLSKPMLTAYS